MTTSKLITTARIKSAHGVKGEVRLQSFTAEPEACFGYGPLLNEAGQPVLTPVKWRAVKDGFVVTLAEDLSREQIDALRGTNLFTRRDALPDPDEDEFYITDLLGLSAVDETGKPVGKIAAVQNFGAGDLLEIDGPDGRFFLAFTKDAVPEVDIAARTVTIVPPDLNEDE